MLTCPNCNSENPSDARFCSECGAPLTASRGEGGLEANTISPASPESASAPPAASTSPDHRSARVPQSPPGTGYPPPPPPSAGYMPPAGSGYGPYPAYPPQPGYPPPYAYAPRPPKDRSIALVLEILPGLLGLLGIGWLYAGNTGAGIAWLVGFLVWNIIATLLDAATLGIFLCLHLPINIACLILSPITLHNYTKQHPELFGA